jgi:hypothetical protein
VRRSVLCPLSADHNSGAAITAGMKRQLAAKKFYNGARLYLGGSLTSTS